MISVQLKKIIAEPLFIGEKRKSNAYAVIKRRHKELEMSTPANGSNPSPPPHPQGPPQAKPPQQSGTLHGSSVTTEPADKKNAGSPTLEKNSTSHIAATNRNISISDSALKDIPTIVSTVKKHSSLWVLFQKVKRFIRTLSMCKDSKNITSKDTKPIPQDMINCIQSLKHVTYDENAVLAYPGDHLISNNKEDPFCAKLSNYNLMCASLTMLEISIKESKETNKTKKSSKTPSENKNIKANKLEKQKLQKKLLSLSKEIFAYADDEIKNSERMVENSDKNVSKKAYTNFFEVLKSNISFDAGKFAEKGEKVNTKMETHIDTLCSELGMSDTQILTLKKKQEKAFIYQALQILSVSDADADETLSTTTNNIHNIDILLSNISDNTDEDFNNLRAKYEAFKEAYTEYEDVWNSESVTTEKKNELFTTKNQLRKDIYDSSIEQAEKVNNEIIQVVFTGMPDRSH